MPGVTGLLESAPGRGLQVARGLEAATGDVVLVLHADSRLLTGAVERMWEMLERRPDAAGGAFGACFDADRPGFRFIEVLNNFRARSLGIAFGDQAQFFRRAALPGGFPALRLMEDVELSLRLKESGAVLFLPDGVVNSARRWTGRAHGGYFVNSLKVVSLTALYLIRRRLGFGGDGDGYYRVYYGRPADAAPAEARTS
jgi:GT2 family glycosyltransferase